ncbi:MAG: valine--tRNA ligase, partial [Deltaproteobacteria bacterium]|nr:valine--tRNA ligase [Deltaproteobacteria bacterium]
DTAVAVHPKDKRYHSLVGKMILLPLAQRKIPIVSDKTVDPQFGTGAVKITPGHDFNDFELGQRHALPMISVLDEKGRMNENAGAEYQGLDRFKARKKVLEDLRAQSLLEKEEDYTVTLGHCDRCETVVEPRLSTQWFVKAKPLALPAMDVVRKKKVKIIPEGWSKTYFNWMENIKDWCISRQIWWGHRIPAWHCRACQKITVSVKDPAQCHQCKSQSIFQDPDVLDTWFSSALWPFSTLGWPQKAKDLKTFYPSAVMETGFDILFFWVARMMMMGIYFMKKPPFKYVYLHAMVRDAQGQKMSKSKGNVIDPLDTIEKYGADALRFTMISLATQGRDVKMAEERIAGYRNFINKIWNATRFVRMNLEPDFKFKELSSPKNLSLVHQWILTRLFETVRETNEFLEEYRLNEAANTVYHFTWHEFCDWYIELIKAPLKDPAQKEETQKVMMFVLRELLKLLHPFLPFVTEELWHHLPLSNEKSIMIASFPKFHSKWVNSKAKKEVQLIIDLISQIRNLRGENNVSPSKLISATIVLKEKKNVSLLSSYAESIKSLAKLSQVYLQMGQTEPLETQNAVRAVLNFGEIFIPMTELFDMEEEKKRLQRELIKVEEDMTHLNSRLSQPAFVERAPKGVVQKEKDRFQELQSKKEKLEESLKKITVL